MMTKETLLTNWHFMRWLRLGMGLYAAVVALQLHDLGVYCGFVFIPSRYEYRVLWSKWLLSSDILKEKFKKNRRSRI